MKASVEHQNAAIAALQAEGQKRQQAATAAVQQAHAVSAKNQTRAQAVQPVEVRVPVAVPCKAPVPVAPAFAVDALPIGSGIWEQLKALRAERWQRKGYETELEAAVKACQ